MKRTTFSLWVILWGIATCLHAQTETPTIDSLKQEIRIAEKGQASREKLTELYQSLGAEYETLNHDSSYRYLQKGLSLYPQPAFHKEGYLQLVNSMGNYWFMEGKMEKAKETFKTVAVHASRLKNRKYDLEGVVESSIGVCYRKLGMFDSAVYHYNRAIDFCKKAGKPEDVSSTYYNIGVLYHLHKRYEEALTQGQLSAEYARKAGDALMEIYANSLIGGAYAKLGKYAEASHILKTNIHKALQLHQPLLAMGSICPLLSTYQLWNQKDSVRIYLRQGENLLPQIPENSPTALEFYSIQASLYHWTGEYQKSLHVLTSHPFIQTQVPYDKFHTLMARNYEGLGDYRKAFQHLQDVCVYQDSIFNGKIKDELSELNEKLRLSDKELKIARLEKEQAQEKEIRLRNSIYFSCVILLLLVAIFFLLHKRRIQKKETELIAARQYIEGLENERKRLAKDLHDGVCNDLLGAILQMQQPASPDKFKASTLHTLEEIRSSVRAISHELMPPNFQFSNLNEMLTDYFAKMQEVSGVTILYVPCRQTGWSHIPEAIGYEIYRIMQETTGNILKHTHAHLIRVELNEQDGLLTLLVQHDGKWTPQAASSRGIGLRTIQDRLKTIGGNYELRKEGERVSMCIHVHLPTKNHGFQ